MEKTITFNRSILQSDWFCEPFVAQIFIYLMFAADHAGYRLFCEDIGRGSTVTTMRTIAQETNLTVYRVRRVINYLVEKGYIYLWRINNYMIVTIDNFEELSTGRPVADEPVEESTVIAENVPADDPGEEPADTSEPTDDIGFADITFSEMIADHWNKTCTQHQPAEHPGRHEHTAIRRLVFYFNNNYGETRNEVFSAIDTIAKLNIESTDDGEQITFGWLIADPKHVNYIASKRMSQFYRH